MKKCINKIVIFLIVIVFNNYSQTNIDSLFDAASQYLNNGQANEAISIYQLIISYSVLNTETTAKAQFMIGSANEVMGNYINAEHEYQNVAINNPGVNNWIKESKYSLADCYYKDAIINSDSVKKEIAEVAFNEFIILYNDDAKVPQAMLMLSIISTDKQQWEQALLNLNNITSYNENLIPSLPPNQLEEWQNQVNELKVEALILKGNILQNHMQLYNEAIAIYDEVIYSSPERKEVQLNKALALIQSQRQAEGVLILEELAVGSDAEAEAAQYYLSQINGNQGE